MAKKPVDKVAAKAADKAAEVKAGAVNVAAAKAADVKPAVKETAAKAEEKAAEVKKETKTAAKAEEKKPAAKKAAKKPAAKKAEKKELVPEVFIQYQDGEDIVKDVLDRIKAAYVEDGHRVGAIKSMQVYLKPEESAAYYVINDGKYSGKVNLF